MTTKETLQKELAALKEQMKQKEKEIAEYKESVDMTSKVKTFEDACEVLGRSSELPKPLKNHEIAYIKLTTIVEALNGGWKPNWDDDNEQKWFPYFRITPFGFDGTCYGHCSTYSATVSRLCFKTKGLAEYAGKQFTDLYEQMMK